jgi:hypothetical protein
MQAEALALYMGAARELTCDDPHVQMKDHTALASLPV